jgi:hypothetical protein
MMDPIQRAVANPPRKIVMQRAARGKVFWDIPPLAAGAQDVHHAVHDRPHVRPPLTAAAFRGRDQRFDICPFVISQVARISQVIAVVLRPVLVRPQCMPLLESKWAPSNPSDSKESRSLRTDTNITVAIFDEF